MKKLSKFLVGAAILAAASSANAVILTVGGWTPLPGTTLALQPALAGVALEDDIQAFSFSDEGSIISGFVQSRVVRSSVDGTLDFYWRIVSDSTSDSVLRALRLGNFQVPSYDANWRIDSIGDTAPDSARLFGGSGGNVNFGFGISTPDGGLAPGASSHFLLLDTNALTYARTGSYDLVGRIGFSGIFATFAPSAIPEPGSLALLGLGMTGLALGRRRKGTHS